MGGKEILYCWVTNGLSVLIPKKRGEGFLRSPYGHHYDSALGHIAYAAGVDVVGLDGSLDFDFRAAYVNHEQRAAAIAKVIPALEKHYGMTSREVDADEFWEKHPLRTEKEQRDQEI